MRKALWGIVFCGINLWALEYIFSYRVAIKDGVILNEKYHFSPAMVSAKMLDKTKSIYKKCEISHAAESEKDFIAHYKEEILECFFSWGVRLEDHSRVRNLQGEYLTLLHIPASRIELKYESGIAVLYALVKAER